jgi:hypothetical protein
MRTAPYVVSTLDAASPIKPMGGICLKCYAANVAELKAEIAALREHIYSGPHSLEIIL